jgi:hypothetical protein
MDIETIYKLLVKMATDFYHSGFFLVIKIFMMIYVAVLSASIVLMIIQRNIFGNIRQVRYGMDMPAELTVKKKKLKARWNKIKEKLKSGNETEYKLAIIEADGVIDGILSRLGYKGETMSEKLDSIPTGQIEGTDNMRKAHEMRNRIIHEEKLKISHKDAAEVFENFECFLNSFEVLS